MSSDLVRKMRAYLGMDAVPEGLPPIYGWLAAGAPDGRDTIKVTQDHMPGGGSENLRWMSAHEFRRRAEEAAEAEQRARERAYNAYGPERK